MARRTGFGYRFPKYTPGPFHSQAAVVLAYRNLAKEYLRWARQAEAAIEDEVNVGRARSSPLLRKWKAEATQWRKRAKRALDRARLYVIDKSKVRAANAIVDEASDLTDAARQARTSQEALRLWLDAADMLVVAADMFREANDHANADKWADEARYIYDSSGILSPRHVPAARPARRARRRDDPRGRRGVKVW